MPFLPWVIPDPHAQLGIRLADFATQMDTFFCEDAPLIAVGDSNVVIFIDLVQGVGVKRVLDTRHYSPTHSVSL